MRRLGLVVALLLFVCVGCAQPPPYSSPVTEPLPWQDGDPVFTPPSETPEILGVNYQGTWNILSADERSQVLDELAAAGVTWVRLDMGWSTIQPDGPDSYSESAVAAYDEQVREIRARGMKILVVFSWGPKWSTGYDEKWGRPGDPQDYADATAWVVSHYNGSLPGLQIEGIELWNEPDSSTFWNPEPEATRTSDFAELVKAAGPAAKSANPNITVVVGAPASVGVTWYTEFYKTPGVVGTYDALGIHPYQSPTDAAPEVVDVEQVDYYMTNIPRLDALMTANDDPARIWATEFGWSTHDNLSFPGTVPNWKRGVTEVVQSDYLLRAMPVLAANPRLQAAFWYAAVTTSSGDAQFDNFALLRPGFSPKPAYYAFKCAAAQICGPG